MTKISQFERKEGYKTILLHDLPCPLQLLEKCNLPDKFLFVDHRHKPSNRERNYSIRKLIPADLIQPLELFHWGRSYSR